MGKTVRTIEVTFEKTESFVVRRHSKRRKVLDWCRECGRESRLLKPEDASRAANLSARKIYRKIEAGQIHFVELAEGGLLVCLNSLKES